MQQIRLSPTEAVFHHATHKVIITHADLAALAAAATGTIQLFPFTSGKTMPIGTVVGFVSARLVTAFDFSDTSINSCLLEIGDSDTDRLLTQTELAADGSSVSNKISAASTQPYAYVAADTVDALFTVSGGGSPLVTEATAGEVHIYLFVSPALPELANVDGVA